MAGKLQAENLLRSEVLIAVPQAFGLSIVLVRNWSSLFLNSMLNMVSDP